MGANYDAKTVEGFGDEWAEFDQSKLSEAELQAQFNNYFKIFPWEALGEHAAGFDMGCGSGRWAKLVAPRVGRLYCIDASRKALGVARQNLRQHDNCYFIQSSFESLPFMDNALDFGYSLGVLHHIPDTAGGMRACVDKLKPGAPFLVYVYYALDNRPAWFRALWRITDLLRRCVSRLPFTLRYRVSQLIALLVYYPLARASLLLEWCGLNVDAFPLSAYRKRSLYTMRTDSLDRFGTRMEKRFTAAQLRGMMEHAGLEHIRFSDCIPYWCAVGYKSAVGSVNA
ncbi:MAG: class I SAM-dependent methyltransferase [Candidatus Aureabacteria bacterium]|nr:class I SAM-dependent methyltransferase [Candidatus Auribacterota bacterium]